MRKLLVLFRCMSLRKPWFTEFGSFAQAQNCGGPWLSYWGRFQSGEEGWRKESGGASALVESSGMLTCAAKRVSRCGDGGWKRGVWTKERPGSSACRRLGNVEKKAYELKLKECEIFSWGWAWGTAKLSSSEYFWTVHFESSEGAGENVAVEPSCPFWITVLVLYSESTDSEGIWSSSHVVILTSEKLLFFFCYRPTFCAHLPIRMLKPEPQWGLWTVIG